MLKNLSVSANTVMIRLRHCLCFCLLVICYINLIHLQINGQNNLNYKKCAEYQIEADFNRNFASDNESLFLSTADSSAKIISLTLKNLALNWETSLGGEISSNLADSAQVIYLTTKTEVKKAEAETAEKTEIENIKENKADNKSTLWAIDANSGLTIRKKELEISGNDTLYVSENYIFIADSSGQILFLDRKFNLIWSGKIPLSQLSQSVKFVIDSSDNFDSSNNGKLFLVSDRDVFQVDLNNQTVKPIFEHNQFIKAFLPAGFRRALIGDQKGQVFSASINNRGLKENFWKFRTGGEIIDLSRSEKNFLITSADNFVYLLSPAGNLKWKRRMPSRVLAPIISADGKSFVTVADDQKLYVLDNKSGKIINIVLIAEAKNLSLLSVNAGNIILIDETRISSFSERACP